MMTSPPHPRSSTQNANSWSWRIRLPLRLTDTRRRRHLMKTVWEHFDTLTGNRLAVWESGLLKNHTLHRPTCYFYALIIQQWRSAQSNNKKNNTLFHTASNGDIDCRLRKNSVNLLETVIKEKLVFVYTVCVKISYRLKYVISSSGLFRRRLLTTVQWQKTLLNIWKIPRLLEKTDVWVIFSLITDFVRPDSQDLLVLFHMYTWNESGASWLAALSEAPGFFFTRSLCIRATHRRPTGRLQISGV